MTGPLDLPEDLDELPPFIGQRTRVLRKLRGLTQQELADLSGLSSSLVSKVEAGRRPPSPAFVARVARALRVPPSRLLTMPDPEASDEVRRLQAGVEAVRREAMAADVPVSSDLAPRSGPELQSDLDRALALRHGNRLSELGEVLPGLLGELRAAAQLADATTAPSEPSAAREAAWRMLTVGYDVAAVYAGQLSQVDLGAVLVARLSSAAPRSGDPGLVHLARWRAAMYLLYEGQYDDVDRLAAVSLRELEPVVSQGHPAVGRGRPAASRSHPAVGRGRPEQQLSLWGQLHLLVGLAKVRAGDPAAGYLHHDEAAQAAVRLGADRNDYGLAFGPTNVQLWGVAMALSDNDAPLALDRARSVRVGPALPVDREARFHLDVASAHLLHGATEASLDELHAARRASPEFTRAQPLTRETVAQLVRARRRLPDSLRRYASWAGVVA